MRLTIPDDLADHLQALAPKKALADIVVAQLTRFLSISPRERVLIIRGPDRKRLEDLLQVPDLTDTATLIEAVRQQGRMTIGGVDIAYSAAQIRELERRARKNHRPLEEEIKDIAQETARLMLHEV